MHPLFDLVTLVNLILCVAIVAISVIGYVKIRSATPLYIGAGFFLFGVSHVATLLGLKTTLETEMIVVRAFGYITVCFGVYLVIREIMLRMRTAEELRTERLELERRVDERTAELQQANEALRASEAQKSAILEGITTNIALVDADLRILWTNAAAARSVGRSPEEMILSLIHI